MNQVPYQNTKLLLVFTTLLLLQTMSKLPIQILVIGQELICAALPCKSSAHLSYEMNNYVQKLENRVDYY